jgi:serine/threonine protein kinase
VYRAIQESVAREVAVKVENRTMDNERDRRRFLREARAAGRMSSHPHVVDLFDAGVTPEGHPYLIMELCEGSYADRMKEGPLSAYEAREVGMKIADALADAHVLGVLHRDVKPANILITRFGEPALADFGLAILAETRDTSVTLDVLTPAYAPPELFRHHSPSPAVDVYALCATLYALMSGRPPRWQKDKNPSLLSLMDLFAEPIPDLPGVPPALMSVLRLGMANEIEERPTAERLRDLLVAVPLEPPPPPPMPPPGRPGVAIGTASVPVRPSSGDQTVPHRPDDPPPVSWRTRLLFGAGVLLLVLLSGGIWYASANEPAPDPSASPLAQNADVNCVLSTVVGARCPTQPECYGRLMVADDGVAHADAISCGQAHTWEVYALAPLPAGLRGRPHSAVVGDDAVRRICSVANLLTVDLDAVGWRVAVLPPTAGEFDAGQYEFRCLAGKGENELTGPTLGRS